MRKYTIFLGLISFFFFLNSCMPTRHYINNVVKNGEIMNSKIKSILIAGHENVQLNNFTKTYKKNYENDKAFLKSYLNEFVTQIRQNNKSSNFEIDTTTNWDVLIEGYNANNQAEINSLFINSDKRYLLYFKNFTINNRFVSSYSPGFGPGSFGHHNTTEFCVVTAKVIVYNIKEKKQILEFDSTGESSVFMFDFTKTLLKAKTRSIENVIEYITTGKRS
ncbi:hypothetical protein [uncultured Tenacibaculum sp.]|uniref:hypothetical protein n=1 Tax=uncultured Tenacibaculum sp. TaxID=174713 RepID=UPI00260B2179|nr:hypothetical protein [uncultured Tenacibaculum sp.]